MNIYLKINKWVEVGEHITNSVEMKQLQVYNFLKDLPLDIFFSNLERNDLNQFDQDRARQTRFMNIFINQDKQVIARFFNTPEAKSTYDKSMKSLDKIPNAVKEISINTVDQ